MRRTTMFVLALVLVAAGWELYKLVGPEDGGDVLGMNLLPRANDRAMPHTWDMVTRLFENESSSADSRPMWVAILEYGWYSMRLALGGLVLGTIVGVGLAVAMARFRVVERGLLPWVIVSQTVPLIALAPQVVSWSGRIDLFGWEWPSWASVCVLAAFLAFFPIAVGTLQGLSSAPPAALELMDSYAASWWQTLRRLRFPAAVPYLIPSLKLGATASVIGVIVSEISIGRPGGIGNAVVSFASARTGDPAKIFSAIFGSAALGLALYGLVVAIEVVVMRNRPQEAHA